MKPILKITSFILLMVVLVHVSCKKEYSYESCIEKNKPPIALAGPDQAITLPTDSVSLDATNTSDPDGKISEWLWTKISGPASFTISFGYKIIRCFHGAKSGYKTLVPAWVHS